MKKLIRDNLEVFRPSKNFLYILAFIVTIIVAFKVLNVNKNERFLNLVGHYYFDQNYYFEHYPEVKSQNIDPFDHYVKYGWKEGKNPNYWFDTNFYVGQYFGKNGTNRYNLSPLADYMRTKLSFKDTNITHPNQVLKAKLLTNPKYYISLVAVFQNEARFLKEWIEFYRLMGVEHFYLYNHLSNDNYMDVLEPYLKEGLVDLKQVTEKPKNIKEWNRLQTRLYTEAAREMKDITEWLIVVDTDEFLFPVKCQDLREILRKYDEYAALSINWKIFGSGDVEEIASDKLMIESLTKSAGDSDDLYVKTIVKPRYVKNFSDPHFPNLFTGYSQVTENFEYFSGSKISKESRNIMRINHYWARDWKFFKSHKLARVHMVGNSLNDEEKKVTIDNLIKTNKNASVTYDSSILRFVKALREQMGMN